MVQPLVEEMGGAYPELAHKQAQVERVLNNEEERFAETLDQGMKVFEEITAKGAQTISGDDAFKLYDTYGFPLDLTADVARERGLTVDLAGFEKAMDVQRERARAASKFDAGLRDLGRAVVRSRRHAVSRLRPNWSRRNSRWSACWW